MRHTEPLLALTTDAAAHVPQSDVLALGALCTVFSKLGSAVADGPRLENLAWRLWHRARTATAAPSTLRPSTLPSSAVTIRPRPASPPSLSSDSSTSSTSDAASLSALVPHAEAAPPTLSPHPHHTEGAHLNAVSSAPVACNEGHRLLPATPLPQAPSQRQNTEQGRMRIHSIALPVPDGWSGQLAGGPLTPSVEGDGRAERPMDVRDGGVAVSSRVGNPGSPPSVGRLISQLFADPPVGPGRRASSVVPSTPSLHSGSIISTPRQPFPTLVVVTPTPHPTPPATPSPGAGEGYAIFGYGPRASPPASQATGPANGQLATPVSVNGDMRGSPAVVDGKSGFFANCGHAMLEAPTTAAMPAQLDPADVHDVAPSRPGPLLLPAVSIGMVIPYGSTSTAGEGDVHSSDGTRDGEVLTDSTASAVASVSTEASASASTSTPATSTAPSALSTPATTPVTTITSPPCPSTPTPALVHADVTSPPMDPGSTSVTPAPVPGTIPILPISTPQPAEPVPGPTPAPPSAAEKKLAIVEDKKFFLAAQRSEGSMGSGVSSESPESGSVGSGSGKSGGSMGMGREVLVGAMGGREALLAKAMAGRVAGYGDGGGVESHGAVGKPGVEGEGFAKRTTSISPGGGIRSSAAKGKGRVGFSIGSSGLSGKRKSGLKKDEVGDAPGSVKGEVKLETQRKSAEPKGKGKDKEHQAVDVGAGSAALAPPRPGLSATQSLQLLPSHHSHTAHGHPHAHANLHGHPHVQPHQPHHHLRQLPTNPPRRQHSPARKSALGAPATKSPTPSHGRGNMTDSVQSRRNNSDSTQPRASNTDASHARPHGPLPALGPDAPMIRHLPYHPQLSHLGLGHLPTVPPKQRRPIEITETSSEYETTDTEGDESSWESESFSGDETGATGGKEGASAGPSKHSRNAGDATSKNGKAATTSANAQRTRDAGEFARDAALEAQRQRDLFQKLPVRSYSNLAQLSRAKSGLSLLFRPDPELFPEGHPYRASKSSRDLLARNWSAPAPPLAVTALSKRGPPVGPMPAAVNADPVVASVNSRRSTTGATAGSMDRHSGGLQRGGYRPRGKPADQEEETDSGEEDPDDAIQLSSSVAQRRLAALMGRRGTQSQQQLRRPSSSHATSPLQPPLPGSALANQNAPPSRPQAVTRTTTAPVLMHPYLPDPAPLQTPHTVRRNIISQELDEELRRNLLWERSQNQIHGRPPRAAGSILPGPWRRLTSSRPEEESEESQAQTSEDKAPGRRPFGTQRTKSWAGDFHASGW